MQYIPRCSGNSTYYTIPQSECTKYRKGIYNFSISLGSYFTIDFHYHEIHNIHPYILSYILRTKIIRFFFSTKSLKLFKNNLNSTQIDTKIKKKKQNSNLF